MIVFVSGGCKNGKSSLAERMIKGLAGDRPLYYIATMIPKDEEDRERVRRHVESRAGLGFATVEQGRSLLSCLDRVDPSGAFLLDSVTALLSNEMFSPQGEIDARAGVRLAGELTEFASRVRDAVFVSDYIYSDSGRYDSYTEAYRRALARCDAALAACADAVAEVCAAGIILHKGAMPI